MNEPEGKTTAFNRSPRDTVAVSLIGAGALLPFLWVAGVVMLWISENWTLGDRLFSTFFAPVVTVIAGGLVAFEDAPTAALLVWFPAALLTCFALSFRMGSREGRLERESGR